MHRDRIARAHPGIDPQPGPVRRQAEGGDAADRGGEVARRIFGADPGLDRVAGGANRVLGGGQGFPGGHAQLPFHQVQAGDRLGDRMLDLQPGVHLQEEEAASPSASRTRTVPAPT